MSSVQAYRAGTGAQADPADIEASELFELHRARVYRFCFGRLGDREEAADAVQDTYAKAWLALRNGCEIRQPLPWLLTIAANVCASRYRAKRARPFETPLTEAAEATVTSLPSAELTGLPAALRALPDGQRRAFVLRELRGCSYEEISRRSRGLAVVARRSPPPRTQGCRCEPHGHGTSCSVGNPAPRSAQGLVAGWERRTGRRSTLPQVRPSRRPQPGRRCSLDRSSGSFRTGAARSRSR